MKHIHTLAIAAALALAAAPAMAQIGGATGGATTAVTGPDVNGGAPTNVAPDAPAKPGTAAAAGRRGPRPIRTTPGSPAENNQAVSTSGPDVNAGAATNTNEDAPARKP